MQYRRLAVALGAVASASMAHGHDDAGVNALYSRLSESVVSTISSLTRRVLPNMSAFDPSRI